VSLVGMDPMKDTYPYLDSDSTPQISPEEKLSNSPVISLLNESGSMVTTEWLFPNTRVIRTMDSARGFAVTNEKMFFSPLDGKEYLYSENDLDIANIEGFWLPKRVLRKRFAPAGACIYSETVEVGTGRLNQGLTISDLRPEIPKNAEITDHRVQVSFISSEKENLDNLVGQVAASLGRVDIPGDRIEEEVPANDHPASSSPSKPTAGRPSQRNERRLLRFAGACLVSGFVLVTYLLVRRRGKHSGAKS